MIDFLDLVPGVAPWVFVGLTVLSFFTAAFGVVVGLGGGVLLLGVMATIGLQAIINLSVVTGMAPTKGIALPLVSAGGTGWVLTAFSLGLLVSMGREAERTDDGRVPAVCVCRCPARRTRASA